MLFGVAHTAIRWVLGVVLLFAAAGKATHFGAFVRTVALFCNTQAISSALIAGAVVAVEVMLGLLLVMGLALPIVAAASGALFGVFALMVVSRMLRGHTGSECGCFGKGGRIGSPLVYRNLALMTAAFGLIGHSQVWSVASLLIAASFVVTAAWVSGPTVAQRANH